MCCHFEELRADSERRCPRHNSMVLSLGSSVTSTMYLARTGPQRVSRRGRTARNENMERTQQGASRSIVRTQVRTGALGFGARTNRERILAQRRLPCRTKLLRIEVKRKGLDQINRRASLDLGSVTAVHTGVALVRRQGIRDTLGRAQGATLRVLAAQPRRHRPMGRRNIGTTVPG